MHNRCGYEQLKHCVRPVWKTGTKPKRFEVLSYRRFRILKKLCNRRGRVSYLFFGEYLKIFAIAYVSMRIWACGFAFANQKNMLLKNLLNYSVDSIKHTVLLKVLLQIFLLVSIKSTVHWKFSRQINFAYCLY